jgi:hypothetical protein
MTGSCELVPLQQRAALLGSTQRVGGRVACPLGDVCVTVEQARGPPVAHFVSQLVPQLVWGSVPCEPNDGRMHPPQGIMISWYLLQLKWMSGTRMAIVADNFQNSRRNVLGQDSTTSCPPIRLTLHEFLSITSVCAPTRHCFS